MSSNLQGSTQVAFQQNQHSHQKLVAQHQQVQDISPSRDLNMQESDQLDEWANILGVDVHSEDVDASSEGDEDSPWKRVKWTEGMARLMITAASYMGDVNFSDDIGRVGEKLLLVPKISKWKAISLVMIERGYNVSPQQCEDKFNDMNKKYKRLQVILGKGISCEVVENPALLELLSLSQKAKEEVKRILGSKQLLYPELCSYHNKNRLFLPHDWELRRLLLSIVRGKNDFNTCEELEDAERHDDSGNVKSLKRKKTGEEHGVGAVGNEKSAFYLPNDNIIGNFDVIDGGNLQLSESGRVRWLKLEKKKLEIRKQMLELERRKLEWLSLSQIGDRKLDKMRMENERLKLENARLELEIKTRVMGVECD